MCGGFSRSKFVRPGTFVTDDQITLYGEELPNQASLLNTHVEMMLVVVMLSLLEKQVMDCLKSETYLRHLVMRRPNPVSVFLKALVWL